MIIDLKSRSGWVLITIALCVCFGVLRPYTYSAPDPAALKVQGPDTIGNFFPPMLPTSRLLRTATTTTGASITATLPGAVGKTTYLTGVVFTMASVNLAGTPVTVTITGLEDGGTANFSMLENNSFGISFVWTPPTPVAASAPNTAIVCNIPAQAVNYFQSITVQGFQN